jgi:hypothetical protein
MPQSLRYGTQHCASEWEYISGRPYSDPFNQIELDVLFCDADGREWKVPAFWAGGQEWRVRFAPPQPGRYAYRTLCSDTTNPDLHGQEGTLEVGAYTGHNVLLQHGPLRVSADRRYVEHADGTPFFWLADLWWLGLCKRLTWPDDFQLLVADRVAKGFSVIQLIAGLPCDMPAFDERCFNEAGYPWEADYARLNPAYFDMADLRIRWLMRAGLVPSIVGAFGFYLPWMGVEKMKQHWRNLIARYGAYPVIWTLAGCGAMPYYLESDKDKYRALQIAAWTEVGRYVRETDPYHHPITIHPTNSAREQVLDDAVLDVDMLMVGGGHQGIGRLLERVRAAVARRPAMPVVNGETGFEALQASNGQDAQRLMFWASWLEGVRGYTYGANGIWQMNTTEELFGQSPWGMISSITPWTDAYRLPGSTQVGLGRRLLERYAWWRFESHSEWIEASPAPARMGMPDVPRAYAAGLPGQVRVVYFPWPVGPWGGPVVLRALEPEVRYRAFYYDPQTAQEHPLGEVTGGADWRVPVSPIAQDWVLVLEAIRE